MVFPSIAPEGWTLPPAWDDLAGDYAPRVAGSSCTPTRPITAAAALRALDCQADAGGCPRAVAGWQAAALESAVVAEGGVAAEMRSLADWAAHPQGAAVTAEPLVAWDAPRKGRMRDWGARPERPLQGLRVLDLTRILAGPVATRALAGFGAEVLRIDPPGWEEPSLAPDVTLGKHCARLDLKGPAGQGPLRRPSGRGGCAGAWLPPGCARPAWPWGGMARGGGAGADRGAPRAYGWTGPWAARRGFDSLVQMSAGIAHAGMGWAGADRPTPLPVQALDHATGYLMAAAVLVSLRDAVSGRGRRNARLSLARTAALLAGSRDPGGASLAPVGAADFAGGVERTPWGPARRLRPPLDVAGVPMWWDRTVSALGSAAPCWG